MTNRRTSHRPSSTSASGSAFGATDRHEPSHFPWPLESTHQPCPPQLPAGIDQEEEPRVAVARYRRVSVAAATSQSHVELQGSHAKLSGIDLRGHNRSHGAHPHQAGGADTSPAPSHTLGGISAPARRSIPEGVDRRAAHQLESRATEFSATRCVTRASYPHRTFQPFSGGC